MVRYRFVTVEQLIGDFLADVERDYQNVHGDVATLEAAGLLVRDGRKLAEPWDEVQASVMLG